MIDHRRLRTALRVFGPNAKMEALAAELERFPGGPLPDDLLEQFKDLQRGVARAIVDRAFPVNASSDVPLGWWELFDCLASLPARNGPPDFFLLLHQVHGCWLWDLPRDPQSAAVYMSPPVLIPGEGGFLQEHSGRVFKGRQEGRLELPPTVGEPVRLFVGVASNVFRITEARLYPSSEEAERAEREHGEVAIHVERYKFPGM